MKHDLKKMLLNEIESRSHTNENERNSFKDKMGKLAGYANYSGLYKFLTEPQRDIKDFNGLLNIVRYLFLDIKNELMSSYILTLDPNKKGARCGLEYLVHNRLFEQADELIKRMKNCSNSESKEWGRIYEIDRLVTENKMSFYDSIEAVNKIRPKFYEMIIYGKMTQIHGYYASKKLELMFQSCEDFEEQIRNIEDDYIRLAYLCRYWLIMITVNMHLNNIQEARKFAKMVLDNSTQESFRSLACLQLGNSYLFESYEEGYLNLNKALLYSIKLQDGGNRLNDVKRSINFLQNYWHVEPEHLDFESNDVSDLHEIAFYYIRSNKHIEASNILNQIDKSKLTQYQLGFHYFYRGLLSRNENDFIDSIISFKNSSDRFYRQISLIELEKLGVSKKILEALSV